MRSSKFPTLPLCILLDDVIFAVEEEMFGLGNDGFCFSCGHQQGGCEPDARNYTCENCGEPEVFGAAEILMNYGQGEIK